MPAKKKSARKLGKKDMKKTKGGLTVGSYQHKIDSADIRSAKFPDGFLSPGATETGP